MTPDAVSRRAQELVAEGTAFVTAKVVRVQRPTSVQAGDVALVLGDGTIEGFVGGVCTQHSVRAHALEAIATGEPVLLRILPGEDAGEVASEEGAVTARNTCDSGGAIELFLEPTLPAPRVLVVGDTPIASAVRSLGAQLGLDLVAIEGGSPEPAPGDLALVVAAHGRDELQTLRRGLEAGVPYVGLVASRKRGAGVIAELRDDGTPEEQLELIDVPAGIAIGARTPAEIALSILAQIVAVRRVEGAPATSPPPTGPDQPATAIDPVCGMTVATVSGTPSIRHGDETIYFCCEACEAKFVSTSLA